MLKKLKPWVIKNSRIPKFLGHILPFTPMAISFLFFVWCRSGTPDKRLVNHETIHFQQQLELLFVLQWILYVLFFLKGLYACKGGYQAYVNNPFELEAYGNDGDYEYLAKRRRYAWCKYI